MTEEKRLLLMIVVLLVFLVGLMCLLVTLSFPYEAQALLVAVRDRIEVTTAETIYRDYLVLRDTPSGNLHGERYSALQAKVRLNQDALYELIFSGTLNERELHELIFFGSHGGSVAKEDNEAWAPFMARVRERQDELPYSIQLTLDWLLETHDW